MDDSGNRQIDCNQLNTTFEYNDLLLYAMVDHFLSHNQATVKGGGRILTVYQIS